MWGPLAEKFGVDRESMRRMWQLCGSQVGPILQAGDSTESAPPGLELPAAFIRWSIRNEWVRSVQDLVERRLLLILRERITADVLRWLIGLLVDEGILQSGETDRAFDDCVQLLKTRYGIHVAAAQG